MDNTIVSSNNKAFRSLNYTTSLLGIMGSSSRASTTFLGFVASGADSVALGFLALIYIPADDLVVITGSDNGVLIGHGETPDFSIPVRVHDFLAFISLGLYVEDGSIASGNEKAAV